MQRRAHLVLALVEPLLEGEVRPESSTEQVGRVVEEHCFGVAVVRIVHDRAERRGDEPCAGVSGVGSC